MLKKIGGLVLFLFLVACVPITAPAAAETTQVEQAQTVEVQELPEGLLTVIPGDGKSHEYTYEGPDYEGQECLQILVEYNTLPPVLEMYLQQGSGRWSYDVVHLLEKGELAAVPLTSFMLKTDPYGALDKSNRYPGGDMDLAGVQVHDPDETTDLVVTEFKFVQQCKVPSDD